MLQFDHIYYSIAGRQTLTDVNFTLAAGEIYGLLGPNGAGKSTVINLISQLRQPDTGQITFRGQRLNRSHLSSIGIAFQENLIYQHLSSLENLQFFGRLYGLTPKQSRQRSHACLAQVNLQASAQATAETLSGGMQRRLNLAIALMHNPPLLILDEPTTGLDIESRRELWQLITNLRAAGTTILLTTHLLGEVEKLSNSLPLQNVMRLGILQQGKLLAEGRLADLRGHIPAQEILFLRTDNDQQAMAIAQRQGWQHRWYGDELGIWLCEKLPLAALIQPFQPLEILAIRRESVGLEHVYLELTTGTST